MSATFEIFLVTVPGMEETLLKEAVELGFDAETTQGGVRFDGDWPDVWRANLWLRGATRVLARIGSFRAFHLAQLDKRCMKFPWSETLNEGARIKVDVTCKASKIYHAKAAAQRIENALKASINAEITSDADLVLKIRIDDNLCTFSLDTSGAALHIRGHKEFVGKAPMRENLAALFLRQCGYAGNEPVLDPMCGSGTFPIEAAEIARNVAPGRSRNFAFENLASFEAPEWQNLKLESKPLETNVRFYGSDRDSGAIRGAQQNAARSGVEAITTFSNHAFSDLQRPDGPPGLIMINPPYGGRIGNKKLLYGLYGALGKTLLERFSGWRVGMVTSEKGLAMASGLPFIPQTAPIPHGGIRITLFQTAPLP